MDGPNGVGVLTSRSRHQMHTGDKSGAAPRRAGVAGAKIPFFLSFFYPSPENRHTDGHIRRTHSREIFSSK